MSFIKVNNVSVRFPIYNAAGRSLKRSIAGTTAGGKIAVDTGCLVIEALKDINFKIRGGERVALLGHNGSGKTTLLRVIAGIYEPTTGEIESQGRITAMLDTNIGISLEATGWENIETRGILLDLDRDRIEQLKKDVAKLSGLGKFLSMPVRTYSAGMRMRLAFCVSTSVSPEILLLDESIIAGDAGFVRMARSRLNQLIADSNILVLASHSHALLKMLCNKGILLNQGESTVYDSVEEMIRVYLKQVNPAA